MKFLSYLVSGLLAVSVATAAYASDLDDIRAVEDARITLVQAIEAALSEHGGVAIEASFDDDHFEPTIEVEVLRDGRTYKVWVNAVDGTVTGAREDRDD
jgi:uncharacterized membrane protein YkoI